MSKHQQKNKPSVVVTTVEPEQIGGDDIVSETSKAPVFVAPPAPAPAPKKVSILNSDVSLKLSGEGESYSARNVHLSYESARTLRRIADGLGVAETDRALENVLKLIEENAK